MSLPPLILYVITDLEIGGVPLHLYRLSQAMAQRGYRVAVVSLAPPGPVRDMLRGAGVVVHSCGGCCGADFRVLSRLSDVVAIQCPDIIHSMLFHANLATRFVAALDGFRSQRVISEIQTVEVERKWHLWVDRLTHRMSRLTIGNSASVVEHLHHAAGIDKSRLRVVTGGIDLARIDEARPDSLSTLGGAGGRVLIWVGRFDPIKGLDILLRAMDVVVRYEPSVRLLLVGEGPERPRIETQIRELKLASKVILTGSRTDVPSLLKCAELFVFPSRTEGLPNALLEAMATGLPIVATDVPGNRDLISNEVTGLLVPFGDTARLASAMIRILTEPKTAERLGRAARLEAQSRWSIHRTWDQYECLYREALRE